MCGIAGKMQLKGIPVTAQEIKKMTDAIAHRGPNDEGIFVEKNVGLGHRRLSIIDLSPAGHQPMGDKHGSLWITFNGEIYNYQELRKELLDDGYIFKSETDTEVIIYLYKKYGVHCLTKLRGMFAFAIWDSDKQELFLAKDRLGKKPLKYYIDDTCFIFASEIKSIITQSEVKKEVDQSAIDSYLTFGYVPAPKTGFKHIQKLEAGHYLIVNTSGVIKKESYWSIDFSAKLELSKEEWKERIVQTLKESVSLRMVADVPIGAHLSGGVDSSLIVALMAELSSTPIKTFSIGFKEKKYNELSFAKLVANRYHTDHHEIIIEPDATAILPQLAHFYEEPFADNSALPTWYLAEATRQHVTVALNGDGADEAFGGYRRYQAMAIYAFLQKHPFVQKGISLAEKFSFLDFSKKEFLASLDLPPPKAYIHFTTLFNPKEQIALRGDLPIPDLRVFDQGKQLKILDQTYLWGILSHLANGLIPKVDIASMAHGLEVRSPFLDQELIELSASMPSKLKTTIFDKKILLKEIARKYIPEICINRPKQGFDAPLEYWFRGEFSSILHELIEPHVLIALGLSPEQVDILIQDHKTKQKNNAKKIWSILMLVSWYKNFFS